MFTFSVGVVAFSLILQPIPIEVDSSSIKVKMGAMGLVGSFFFLDFSAAIPFEVGSTPIEVE